MSALTPAQAIRLIILPQVVYVALPNFGNMLVALIQESSLAYLIGVVDVMGLRQKIIDNMSYGAHIIEVYFCSFAALLAVVSGYGKMYWICCQEKMERCLGDRR